MISISGYTEQEIIDTIYDVCRKLATKFKFGYNEKEDIIQEGVYECLRVLDKYDPDRPLANFLYVHAHNRLFNYKRNNYIQHIPPCHNCPIKATYDKKTGECSEYKDKMACSYYKKWYDLNIARRNIMHLLTVEVVDLDNEKNMYYNNEFWDLIDQKDLFAFIDQELPAAFREDYVRLKTTGFLQKSKMEVLREELLSIFEKYEEKNKAENKSNKS